MNLKNLAKKPELIKLTIDNEDIVKEFGEPLDFYCYDRHPMDVFLKVATKDRDDHVAMMELLKTLILDEAGQPIITDEEILPPAVMMSVFTKLVEFLGK